MTAPTVNDLDVPWQHVDPASLASVTVEALDRFFLEMCRRTVGGDLRAAHPVSTLEIAGVERYVTRRYGSPTAGLTRAERLALAGGTQPPAVAWDVFGVPGLELRARWQPPRDGNPATLRIPVQLRDEHALPRVTAAWRQTFGTEPQLVALRAPERVRTKGPPFRCSNCGDPLPSEPEETRTCPRCLASLELARPVAANQWGPLRAELHGPGLHRLFSSFARQVNTDVSVDVVFEAFATDAAVPPCAGVAIGPMGATRSVLLRPDGTFCVTREQLVEGREAGQFPRERVIAIDWTEHPALGRGLEERTHIRVTADHKGLSARLGEHILFELPPLADDADGKCVCLVAACDTHGATVRFERFGVEAPPPPSESAPEFDDPTIVDRPS